MARREPGELRGRVVAAGGRFLLTDLDGTTTAFDAVTGAWLATTDRWGNTLQGGFDGQGNLVSVADAEGRQIQLAYIAGQLAQVTLPGGASWRLGYQGNVLTEVFDPLHAGSQPSRTFSYAADSQGVIRLLTAARDEAGVLLEGHAYDVQDRGVSSVSEGGRNQVSFEYATPAGGQTRVTHAIDGVISQVSVFTLVYGKGRYLPTEILGDCPTCGGATSDDQHFTYTNDNHVASRTDGNGHVTQYAYNGDGNVTAKTEAVGTAQQRTTAYRYGYAPWPNFLTEMDEPSAAKAGAQKVTTSSWNAAVAPETVITTAEAGYLLAGDGAPTVYTTTRTFDARHRLLSVAGPRTDVAQVTSQSYYADNDANANRRGRLQSATDASGNVSTFDDYDEYGMALTAVDPNGVVTARQTDARGRVVASTSKAVLRVAGETSDYTTSFTFDGRDRLTRTILPRGNRMAYGYEDGTSRLLDTIRLDAAGNQLERHHLTLNVIGDEVMEEDQGCGAPASACASWTTKHSESFAYDVYNRLAGVLHPVPPGSRTFNTYDLDGQLSTVQDDDHTSPNTSYTYDALHRMTAVRQTLASAPGGAATTSYGYDVMDNLASVTDPNGNTTTYHYDDFHRLARQDSPVTGTTTYQYDPAGNLVATTDARGAATTRTYDASNRVPTSTSQLAGAATETVTYGYDSAATGSFGKGRLARMTDPSGATAYAYERRGLLKSENRSILGSAYGTAYQYDANGNRSGMTYPSGRQVVTSFDFADRPFSAAAGTTTYVASASYLPFGPEAQLVFGNGTTQTRSYDLRYRPIENRLDGSAGPTADYLYGEDPAGNITSIHDALDATFNRDFAYDDLFRLTGASTGAGLWGPGSYAYDAMGNMTSLALGSSRAATFSYNGTLPTLSSVSENGFARAVAYDPAGNEIAVGSGMLTYSARNLLASGDGLAYTYDGRGVRVALAVTAALGSITGTVVDAQTGAPLAGAAVRITGTANATATDGAGIFNLTAPAGLYTLTAALAGYLPAATTPFTLAAGGSFAAGMIRLQPAPGLITGTVVDAATSTPLAGATVSLAENGDSTVTDTAGAFSLSERAGTYTVTVAQAGYPTYTLPPFALAAGATHALGTIPLIANPATLTGHVVSSAGGVAIAGATVIAASLAGAAPHAASRAGRADPASVAMGATPASTFTATTDAAGNFTLQVPPGTYGVTVTATGFSSRTTSSVSLGPGAVFALGTLALDAAGTITGSVVAANGGAPVPGATVGIVGTLNLTTADAAGRFTLTQPAGTYRLQVTAAGFVPTTTAPLTVSGGAKTAAGTITLSQLPLAVYVGYADNRQPSSSLPAPWQGSPNVVFLGSGSPDSIFDAGAVRLDNATDQPIAVDRVTVDLQRPGIQPLGLPPPVFNLWGSFTVPAHGTAILTQRSFPDFDTSDYAIVGCGQNPAGDPRIPKVTVVTGGVATDYFDNAHVLDTGGSDAYYCSLTGSEAIPWQQIGTVVVSAGGAFQLAPASTAAVTGNPVTLTATVTDTNQRPVPNVNVTFTVTASPGQGMSGQAVTDASGLASFTFTSTIVGTSTVQAAETDAFGNVLRSNLAKVTWQSPFPLGVFVGYADDARPHPDFPVPWQGAPNVLFLGAGPFDDGAVRLDNLSDSPLAVDKVVVDMQVKPGLYYAIGPTFSLWGSFTIPPHQSAILTGYQIPDFDTSDVNGLLACNQPIPPDYAQIPKITVTIGGSSTSYLDTAHILDTFGTDRFWCLPGDGNESLQWREIGGSASTSPGRVFLLPAAATVPLSALAQVTSRAVDAGGGPLAGVAVAFTVKAGPNAGRQGQATTDGNGVATFSYGGTAAGADTLGAAIANLTGGAITSGPASVTWVPAVQLALTPASAAQQVGTPYNATLTATDGAGQPLPNLLVTFQITSGPNAGKTAQQTTGAGGQTLFSYTSTTAGADTLTASVGIQNGGALSSSPVTATWTSPLSFSLAPLTVSQPAGTAVTFTATLLDGGGQPVGGVAIGFTVASGPDAGTSAQATTGANGQALFTFTGTAAGSDLVQATAGSGGAGGGLLSNPATVAWTAAATAVTYTGPSFGDYGDALTLAARLTQAATGQALAGQTLSFTLGTQTLSGVTDATGTATVTITPALPPSAVALSIVFAGGVGYGGSAASVLLAIHRDDTALVYAGPKAVANGQPQPVSAVLTDPQSHAPLAGKTVTFSVGSVIASGTTDAAGTATASLMVPASVPTGPALLLVAFAGDATDLAASTTVPVVVYQPASFVIWGGNTPGLAVGQYVNFWGSQWARQVTGGDYQANPSFKGYAQSVVTPVAICEPSAHTSGSPQLDSSCWTSKPGNSKPPATLSAYIGVIVATSIAKQGSSIYGNIAALVVVQVDPGSPYGSDPGHPGYGTIAAVIQDGTSFFPPAAPRRSLAPAGASSSSQTGASEVITSPPPRQPIAPAAIATGNWRYFFYSPELHLLAESELTTSTSPAILTEYIWFGDHPVAQSDTAGATSWTFTDHLGTPILQTSAAQGVTWRAEYEPYGSVFTLRSSDQHQPLRLPGQEAQQLTVEANGVTSRDYNIYRWYQPEIGRYSSPDPLGGRGDRNPYAYAMLSPVLIDDPLGLKSRTCCTPIADVFALRAYKHCFIEVQDQTGKSTTYSLHGMGTPHREWGGPVGCKFTNDAFDRNAIGKGGTQCGPWSDDCSSDQCVKQQYDTYPLASTYKLMGPNSNTFAGTITRACHLSPPDAVNTWHTPGWNDPKPAGLYLPSFGGGLSPLPCPARR